MSVSFWNTGKIGGVGRNWIVYTSSESVSIVTTSSTASSVITLSWNVNVGSFDVCILFYDAHPFTVVISSGGIDSTTLWLADMTLLVSMRMNV